jgi:hypothetical protein
MSIAPGLVGRRPLGLDYQRLVNSVFALFIFSGIISVIEPSPYDFMSLIPIPLWFIGGFRVHAALVPILFITPSSSLPDLPPSFRTGASAIPCSISFSRFISM